MKLTSIVICIFLSVVALADEYTMAPDGTYVGGESYTMAPDGTYVGSEDFTLTPDGAFVEDDDIDEE